MNRGRLVVISAPSGAGKTSICKGLQARHPEWAFSVSSTTRPQREDEQDGRDYFFLSDRQFEERLARGDFVEWELVHGYRYGTLRETLVTALEMGQTLLLDVDVKGGVSIKNQFPDDAVTIFIIAPDMETLIRRLKGRGTEAEEVMRKRLERIPEELSYKQYYDHVVLNDDLNRAIDEVEAILMEKE